jgi:predicted ArsR family transcriptional regulator
MLDRIDKAILRLLIQYKELSLTTNKIAIKVKISPRTAKKHLDKLKQEGYVEMEEGKIREYKTKEKEENAKNKKTN